MCVSTDKRVYVWHEQCTTVCLTSEWTEKQAPKMYLYKIITKLTPVGTDSDRLDLIANYWCFCPEVTGAQDKINFILQNRCVFHDSLGNLSVPVSICDQACETLIKSASLSVSYSPDLAPDIGVIENLYLSHILAIKVTHPKLINTFFLESEF